jgi:hypothetical protein
MLCNGVKREVVKASPDLASRLFYYVPLHYIRYGINIRAQARLIKNVFLSSVKASNINCAPLN